MPVPRAHAAGRLHSLRRAVGAKWTLERLIAIGSAEYAALFAENAIALTPRAPEDPAAPRRRTRAAR